MGYQALLFCPDEKLSIVVTHLFGELDFRVELVQEPFAAVKKLMAQHYDAVVVDIENEQNASLLFKSARNSSSNHSSLAIAMVAGQAGITKAYRIGANLVLTKPINVEQIKGTLRVARGLLRKTSEAAGVTAPTVVSAGVPAKPGSPTLVSAAGSGETDRRKTPRLAFSSVRPEASASEPSLSQGAQLAESPEVFPGAFPEATAAATIEDQPEIGPPAATPHRITMAEVEELPARHPAVPVINNNATNATDISVVESVADKKQVKSEADDSFAGSASSPARRTISAFPSPTGSATAPASAPEVAGSSRGTNRIVESEPAGPSPAGPSLKTASGVLSHDSTPSTTFSAEPSNDSPMFAGVNQDSGGLSANKKMLIAAVIVLALAALMYLGYGWFVRSRTPAASQSVSLNQGSANPTAEVDPQPSATPAPSPSKPGGPNAAISTPPANPAHTPSSGQPLAGAGKTTVISISASAGAHDVTPPDEPEIRKPDSKPLRVKSTGIGVKNQRQADESAPQLPAIVASANENNLSGVMSSGSTSVPKLSLTTVKISQGVSEGLIIKRVQPKYPRTALQAHAQGAVQIEATINKEGFVTRPKVLSGEPVLARAALEAVSQWRYKPYYLDGAPVEIQTQITINFRPN